VSRLVKNTINTNIMQIFVSFTLLFILKKLNIFKNMIILIGI